MMKKDYLLNQREGLALAMQQLFHYQTWATITLDNSEFEEESLLEYFEAELDDPKKADYEKVIAAAITRAVYEKEYIPEKSKRDLAIQATRDTMECLEVADIRYHTEVKGMSEREARKRLQNNRMIKRVAYVDNMAKWGVRRVARVGVSFGLGALVTALCPAVAVPTWVVGIATYTIISVLPEKIRKPIREAATKAIDSVAKTAKNIAQELSQKAVHVAEKAKSIVEKVTHVAQRAWEGTKNAVKNVFAWMFK